MCSTWQGLGRLWGGSRSTCGRRRPRAHVHTAAPERHTWRRYKPGIEGCVGVNVRTGGLQHWPVVARRQAALGGRGDCAGAVNPSEESGAPLRTPFWTPPQTPVVPLTSGAARVKRRSKGEVSQGVSFIECRPRTHLEAHQASCRWPAQQRAGVDEVRRAGAGALLPGRRAHAATGQSPRGAESDRPTQGGAAGPSCSNAKRVCPQRGRDGDTRSDPQNPGPRHAAFMSAQVDWSCCF